MDAEGRSSSGPKMGGRGEAAPGEGAVARSSSPRVTARSPKRSAAACWRLDESDRASSALLRLLRGRFTRSGICSLLLPRCTRARNPGGRRHDHYARWMDAPRQPTFWEQLSAAARVIGTWIEEHQEEIRAAAIWGTVSSACTDARLYAPLDREAWRAIVEAISRERRVGAPDYKAIITSIYGPGGGGFETLRQELLGSPLLQDRQREVTEVLSSMADGRNYVAICGTLPLVEYVISAAAGKWNHPHKHLVELKRRLHDDDFDANDTILLEYSAVQMVLEEIPNVWNSGRQQIGAVVDELNRHYALHGTGIGWDDSTNATRAALLLAAAARVADALFKPLASVTAKIP